MKKCPYCSEEIQDEARKCRYCNEWIVRPQPYQTPPPSPKVKEVSFIFKPPFSKMDNRPLSYGLPNADLGLVVSIIAISFSCISLLIGFSIILTSICLAIALYLVSNFLENFNEGNLSRDVKIIALAELGCILTGLLSHLSYFFPTTILIPITIFLVVAVLYFRVGWLLRDYYDDYESFTYELRMLGNAFIAIAIIRLLQAITLGLTLLMPDLSFAILMTSYFMTFLTGGGLIFVSASLASIFYKVREWKETANYQE